MVDDWGDEVDGEVVETGVSDPDLPPEDKPLDPSKIDINTMSTQDFLALTDWQFNRVLVQIVAELGNCARKRAELAVYYYEYKGLQEQERTLVAQKSAVQSILRTARET